MNLKDIADLLWKDPNDENWSKFREILLKSNAKYYRVVYIKELKNKDNLKDSYAELYDSKQKLLAKIPIYKKTKSGIEGATYYLRGLYNINKV